MRTLFIIPLVLMSLVLFSSWGSHYKGLVAQDGLYFEKFSNIPYAGEDVGPLLLETGSFVEGKLDGLWTKYYLNGQFRRKGEYQNGKRSGHWVFRHETGVQWSEGRFKEGLKEGL